jgi:hypothetical protein
VQTSSGGSSSLNGCLEAFATILLVIFSLSFIIGAAQSSLAAGAVFTVLIVGTWIGVSQWRKRRRAARALALAQAQAEEHQRQLYAYHAEQERLRAERWSYLVGRYGEGNAHKIWAGRVWVGCSVDMLRELLGPPEAIDEKVLKTKVNHTFKYRSTGANRYALRVFLSDGEVTGWEDKTD